MSDDKRMERIESKIDDIGDRMSSIDTTLVAQHESLRYHIKRTDLNEKAIDSMRREQFKLVLAILGAIIAASIEIWVRK